jgi:hypothetical protein
MDLPITTTEPLCGTWPCGEATVGLISPYTPCLQSRSASGVAVRLIPQGRDRLCAWVADLTFKSRADSPCSPSGNTINGRELQLKEDFSFCQLSS